MEKHDASVLEQEKPINPVMIHNVPYFMGISF